MIEKSIKNEVLIMAQTPEERREIAEHLTPEERNAIAEEVAKEAPGKGAFNPVTTIGGLLGNSK